VRRKIKRLKDARKDEATVQSKQLDAVGRMSSEQHIHQSTIIALEV